RLWAKVLILDKRWDFLLEVLKDAFIFTEPQTPKIVRSVPTMNTRTATDHKRTSPRWLNRSDSSSLPDANDVSDISINSNGHMCGLLLVKVVDSTRGDTRHPNAQKGIAS